MKIYVVIVQDRHSDIEIKLFANKEQAIDKARQLAHEYCSHKEDYEEDLECRGWVFFVRYSCEGDNIRVIEKTL